MSDLKKPFVLDPKLTPEGSPWLAKAGLSFWLKRWDKLYNDIVAKLDVKPENKTGEKIAKEWRSLIEEHLVVPHQFI
jgi:hypothetical protein